MSLENKQHELMNVVEEFKTNHKKELDEMKKKQGSADAILKEMNDRLNNQIDTVMDEIKKIQTAQNRPELSSNEEKIEIEKSAFNKWMKKGDGVLTPEELKTLNRGSDADGGFTVRSEISNQIVEGIYETSPMRQLADVMNISTDAVEILVDWDDTLAVGWVGESETRSSTATPKLKQIRIAANEIYAFPFATQIILDDSSIDMESWLSQKVLSKMARTEATAHIAGTGSNQPRGITTYSHGTTFGTIEQVPTAASGAVDANALIQLQNTLYEAYQPNAKWLMARATATDIRQLTNGVTGDYIWSIDKGTINEAPLFTLLGKPVFYAADMPAVAADALAVAYGDFREGYQIIDRIGMRVLRDPYTVKGSVGFYTTRRTGGDVKNFQSIKLLKLATSV